MTSDVLADLLLPAAKPHSAGGRSGAEQAYAAYVRKTLWFWREPSF
jgi:hypothetical protein